MGAIQAVLSQRQKRGLVIAAIFTIGVFVLGRLTYTLVSYEAMMSVDVEPFPYRYKLHRSNLTSHRHLGQPVVGTGQTKQNVVQSATQLNPKSSQTKQNVAQFATQPKRKKDPKKLQVLEELSKFDQPSDLQAILPNASLGNGTLVRTESQIPEINLLEAVGRKLVTIVSGYFEIPGMPHHPVSYYQKHIEMTVTFLQKYGGNTQVIFYHNLDLENHPLNETWRTSGFVFRKINIHELPGANVSRPLKNLCLAGPKIDRKNNKCKYLHEKLSRSESFVDVLAIWFSKLPLLERVIRENPFNTVYFAWFDCGIRYRLGPRIHKYELSRYTVGTPKSGMRYGPTPKDKEDIDRKVGHRMGLVAGPGHKLLKVIKLHEAKLQEILTENLPFCYDEELVLAEVFMDRVYYKTVKYLFHFFLP